MKKSKVIMVTPDQTSVSDLPVVLTLQQACEVLNCHPNTLRNWDNEGTLKAIRFGKRGDRRYHKEDVIGLLNRNK